MKGIHRSAIATLFLATILIAEGISQPISWKQLDSQGFRIAITLGGDGALYGSKGFDGYGESVGRSTDGGTHWDSLGRMDLQGLGGLFVTRSGIIYGWWKNWNRDLGTVILITRSTDKGRTWAGAPCIPLVENSMGQLIGSGSAGLYSSSDSGASWSILRADLALTADQLGIGFILSAGINGDLWLGYISGRGIEKSTDDGQTWLPANTGLALQQGRIQTIAQSPGGTTYAVYIEDLSYSYSTLYSSTDEGSTWAQVSYSPPKLYALFFGSGGVLYSYFPTVQGGSYYSSNGGVSWALANDGLPTDQYIRDMVADRDGYLYAFDGTNLYRSTRSILTSIPTRTNQTLSAPALYQNYPNPFNPTTTIRYALPHRSHVILTVFNTHGQRVAELENADVNAGSHEVQFDAGDLATGVYFYRLSAGSFVDTKKFVLIK